MKRQKQNPQGEMQKIIWIPLARVFSVGTQALYDCTCCMSQTGPNRM